MNNVVSLSDYRTSKPMASLRKQLIVSYKNKVLRMTPEQRATEKQALAQLVKAEKAASGGIGMVTYLRVQLYMEVENDSF